MSRKSPLILPAPTAAERADAIQNPQSTVLTGRATGMNRKKNPPKTLVEFRDGQLVFTPIPRSTALKAEVSKPGD
ncbi:hypothetical protein BH11PLA2_BH11PLA2_35960 [soil metagenome]